VYENRKQPLLSTAKFLKRVARHWLAGFGFWPWRRHSRLSLHWQFELDRFAPQCVDDPRRNGSCGSLEDQRRKNFRVVLRFILGPGVHRYCISTTRAVRSSPAASRSRRGAMNKGFSEALRMKKVLSNVLVVAVVLGGVAGCAQIKKPAAPTRVAAIGLRFDQVGWVSLYAGEPCTPQIMFDFHGSRSTVWLAASRRETKTLTDAAKKNLRVHILGKWRRGQQSQCSYVEVTGAELTR
jgi:hypothetical protein